MASWRDRWRARVGCQARRWGPSDLAPATLAWSRADATADAEGPSAPRYPLLRAPVPAGRRSRFGAEQGVRSGCDRLRSAISSRHGRVAEGSLRHAKDDRARGGVDDGGGAPGRVRRQGREPERRSDRGRHGRCPDRRRHHRRLLHGRRHHRRARHWRARHRRARHRRARYRRARYRRARYRRPGNRGCQHRRVRYRRRRHRRVRYRRVRYRRVRYRRRRHRRRRHRRRRHRRARHGRRHQRRVRHRRFATGGSPPAAKRPAAPRAPAGARTRRR